MSFTFTKLNQKSDLDMTVFSQLFQESFTHLDRNYPWTVHGLSASSSYDEKFSHIRLKYHHAARNPQQFLVWKEEKDGKIIGYHWGELGLNRSTGRTLLYWNSSLYGPDANGSKAYLHSTEYTQAGIAFWNSLDIYSLRMTFSDFDADNTIYQNAANRKNLVVAEGGGTIVEADDSSMTWTF